ncbi:hypothetical protein ACMZOO_14155 [Catenovulum sp. SX2]|uniref:hypothetical protein n=1 Tax=Catenovulum sp. SX2 TaxID=3398614 RepID=UPI003F83E458
MSQLNTYQMAVLAELNIDTFKAQSSVAAKQDIPTTTSVAEISKPAEKIDHLAQIKSAIGLAKAETSEPVTQKANTQVRLVNFDKLDLAALKAWFKQVGLNCQDSQQTNQANAVEQLIFDQALDKAVFNFDLSKAEDKQAFWQLISRFKF